MDIVDQDTTQTVCDCNKEPILSTSLVENSPSKCAYCGKEYKLQIVKQSQGLKHKLVFEVDYKYVQQYVPDCDGIVTFSLH